MGKFAASVTRMMYYSTDTGGTSTCPRCGARLEQDYQSYSMFAGVGEEMGELVVGTDAGYFCPSCPTVVLDMARFMELAKAGLGRASLSGTHFAVAGLVDMAAIPPDKRNMPLGGDDNPVPVVSFDLPPLAKPGKPGRKLARRLKRRRR